jgi:DNA gyrase/topoisomerase IV subunit B
MSNNKSIEEIYKKKTQLEHIIDIPDTYIGSIEKTDIDTWVYDESLNKIVFKNIKYIPGLYKIFDEVLVNAIDQHVRTENDNSYVHKVNNIKVNFTNDNNTIVVYNNGEGIPIVEHKEHNVWVPELIFGHLLTSSNYDANEKKITGGKNGYGAKLANIFSSTFKIETVDSIRKMKYVQTFEKNMSVIHPPIITPCSAKPYTIIEFSPDLQRFGIDKISDDTINLMKKRVFDITACTNKNVIVSLNDTKIECKTLDKYINYYFDENVEKVCEEVNDRWEVAVVINNDAKFEQVSFVNGIATIKGGKHVDYVVNNIIKKVQTHVSTKGIKRKKFELKPTHIKENIFIFIRSIIENPAFDSQIKENLTTPSTKFGSKCEVSDKFIEKLIKTTLIDRALKLSDFKDNIGLQKVNGKKTNSLRGVEKLDDANKAGGTESLKCTLILTEGDSAKALAIAGLSVVGRDYFGVFPLRGKVLNVRDVPLKKVSDNNEISNLVKIMGLKFNKKGKEEILKDLRYGRIMIFTDADVDGSHIKGLLMNLFSIFWPDLLEIPGFIISLATPIIKAIKNKDSVEFYTMTEFNTWKNGIENMKQWNIKYYKGLGTSTSEEAKSYFTNFDSKNICYVTGNDENDVENKKKSFDKLELAFDKKRIEDRKLWLKSYDYNNIIDQSQKKVFYHEFIDKELIHFSDYDCKRSIPSLCDGLKPSFRKIIYSCFKRNLKKEVKVAQLAGYISENSAYHHGEQSLYDSIIGLAQDFVGSNNIELLVPQGQFGCLAPETPILLFDGTIKAAVDIVEGDLLIGDDGTSRKVLKTTSGTDEMYEVKTEYDDSYIINKSHILTLYNKVSKKVIDVKLEEYLKFDKIIRQRFLMIGNHVPIDWDFKENNVDLYSMGASMKLLREYIINNKESRLLLLGGFVDFYCTINNSGYYDIDPNIEAHNIEQLKFLCNSLGFVVHDKKIYGNHLNEIVTKKGTIKNSLQGKEYCDFSVEFYKKSKFCGWSVNKNERFLLGNFVVTHNSRLAGGHDSASPRYIFTHLNEITYHIFNPLDNPLLEYNEDDGKKIEPLWYIPILPLILVNGTDGIGTGFSTKIPPHNPEEIVKNLINIMDDKPFEKMIPWFRGFKGVIEFKTINDYGLEQFVNKGIYKVIDDTTVMITELPIGKWTDDYKTFLESLLYDKGGENNTKQCLVDFWNNSTEKVVNYTLKFKKDELQSLLYNGELEVILKLSDCKYTNYSNMHLYNNKGSICKYDSINQIMYEFYFIRFAYYTKRKEYMLKTMEKELNIYKYKIKFIEEFIDGTINIMQKEDEEVIIILEEREYMKFGNDDSDGENEDNASYEYLLNMKIKSLTKKRIDELKKLYESKLASYHDLMDKNEKDLWKADLNAFLKVYTEKMKEYNEKMNEQIKMLQGSTKKNSKKTK